MNGAFMRAFNARRGALLIRGTEYMEWVPDLRRSGYTLQRVRDTRAPPHATRETGCASSMMRSASLAAQGRLK
jgi:hypothetical protein